MAANTNPIFTLVPKVTAVAASAANANRDGTGTIVDLFTPAVDGSLLESIRVKAIVTTTAGMIRLWVYDGAAWKLLDEIVVTAITVAAGVAGFVSTWIPPNGPLALPSGRKIGISTHNAEAFHATASGGDFS